MALRETIELDVAAARRQIQSLETALDSLATTIDIDVSGDAQAEIRQIDDRLDQAALAAERLATEMIGVSTRSEAAENNVQELARALGISEGQAADLAREFNDAVIAGGRLEGSARDIARQLGVSDEQADQLTAALRRADAAAEDINVRAGTLTGSFGNLRTIVGGLAGILATIGIGRGIGAAVQGARSAVNEFARLNESINAVEVTFEEASAQIFAFGEISARSAGLSAQTFQQAVVPIGAVLRNFGFDARDAASASIELVQRAADLASVFNTDVNDALLAINSALVGQVEPLRRYGAEISVARAEQFAFATGLAQTKDDLDANVLTQARLGLILQDTNRVAGDFVNTSGDFANASRIAKAGFEELSAEVGEALLPAFEALLALAPEIIAGLESLAPIISDIADAVADFATSFKAGDIAVGFQTITAAAGTGFDAMRSGLDGISALAALLRGDFDTVGRVIENFSTRSTNALIRVTRIDLAKLLQSGVAPADALGMALAAVAQQANGLGLLVEGFDDLTSIAGLADDELAALLRTILLNADALKLNEEAIGFLRAELNDLNEQLDDGGRANDDYLASIERINAALAPGTRAAPRFTQFVGELEAIADRVPGASAAIVAAIDNLADQLDPFKKATEALDVSAQEFFDAVVLQAEELAAFEADVTILRALGFDKLADELKAAGPGARQAVRDFLGNLDLAKQANDVLAGKGTAAITFIGEELRRALVALDLTPQAQAALIDNLVEGGILSPQVADAVRDAMNILAGDTETGFRDGMVAQESAYAADLQATLTAAFDAVNAELAAAGLISHLEEVFRNVRFRINSGQLIIPDIIRPDLIDRPTTTTPPPPTGGGGTTVNVFYPQAVDPATSIQQGAQLASAIGNLTVGFV